MIGTHELTKKYGETVAVDHLTFRAVPGRVTPSCWPPASPSSSTSQAWMDFRPPARSSLPSPGHTRTGHLPGPRLRQRALITGLRPRGTERLPVGDPLAAGAREGIP